MGGEGKASYQHLIHSQYISCKYIIKEGETSNLKHFTNCLSDIRVKILKHLWDSDSVLVVFSMGPLIDTFSVQ